MALLTRTGDDRPSLHTAKIQNSKARKRDGSIETLRGLAIILMVAGHVIGEDAASGIQVDADSGFRHFHFSLQFLRMPLFTVISGYVYSLRPIGLGEARTFLKGKARRILIPLVSVATLEFLVAIAVPGVEKSILPSEIWKIYIFPFDHFWFLQAIFLGFLTVALLERLQTMRTVGRWALTVAGALAVLRWFPNPPAFFSFRSFLYLLPFLLGGIGLGRFAETLSRKAIVNPALALLAVALLWQQGAWFGWDLPMLSMLDTGSRTAVLGMTVGLTGCLVLFRFRWDTRWLARLGGYSFSIYLFHVFGTAGMRFFSGRLLQVEAKLPLFLMSLVAGLVLPILLELGLSRTNPTRVFLLGLRPKRAKASTASPVSLARQLAPLDCLDGKRSRPVPGR